MKEFSEGLVGMPIGDATEEQLDELKRKNSPFRIGELVQDSASEHNGAIYGGYFPIIQNSGLEQSNQAEKNDRIILRDDNDMEVYHHVFLAPTDLLDKDDQRLNMGFNEAVDNVASLNDYLGRNGIALENHTHFIESIKQGEYDGQWRLLSVQEISRAILAKNVRGLKGTFDTNAIYGTTTNFQQETKHYPENGVIYTVNGTNGLQGLADKDEPLTYRAGYSVLSLEK